MICPTCGYEDYYGQVHPWGGEATPSKPRYCRGVRRVASRKEVQAAIDFLPRKGHTAGQEDMPCPKRPITVK